MDIASLEADVEDLRSLAAMACLAMPALSEEPDEAGLEAAALELRRQWLRRAHRPADVTLKSPDNGSAAYVPGGGSVRFGYERDLDAGMLEERAALETPPPPGWSAIHLLVRSGQAALSCLLQLVLSLNEDAGRLRMHHAGRYFETAALLGLLPRQTVEHKAEDAAAVDLLVGEPVHCDGQFGLTVPESLPRVRRALLVDTTLGGEANLGPWFARVDGPLVAVFRSGLKLDQAGLELANVGIVQLCVRDGAVPTLADVAARFRQLRTLTGSGLTLDEVSALSAPWFLHSSHRRSYAARVFAHNEQLAVAIGRDHPRFLPACHPSLLPMPDGTSSPLGAPFCALRLRKGDALSHRRLLADVAEEVERAGLVVVQGGSFGFRGPRYELIEPDHGAAFLRVALGFRGGPSTVALIEQLASRKP